MPSPMPSTDPTQFTTNSFAMAATNNNNSSERQSSDDPTTLSQRSDSGMGPRIPSGLPHDSGALGTDSFGGRTQVAWLSQVMAVCSPSIHRVRWLHGALKDFITEYIHRLVLQEDSDVLSPASPIPHHAAAENSDDRRYEMEREASKEQVTQAVAHRLRSKVALDQIAVEFALFRKLVRWVTAVFSYLNSVAKRQRGIDPVDVMCFGLWNDIVMKLAQAPLKDLFFTRVQNCREGSEQLTQHTLDRLLSTCEMLQAAAAITHSDNLPVQPRKPAQLRQNAGVTPAEVTQVSEYVKEEVDLGYICGVEEPYIQELRSYYASKADSELSRQGGFYTFLRWVDGRRQFEVKFALRLNLQHRTVMLVMQALSEATVFAHAQSIVSHRQTGISAMFEQIEKTELSSERRRLDALRKTIPDLVLMHRLVGPFRKDPADKHTVFGDELRRTVVERGRWVSEKFLATTATGDTSDATEKFKAACNEYVDSLMELHAFFHILVQCKACAEERGKPIAAAAAEAASYSNRGGSSPLVAKFRRPRAKFSDGLCQHCFSDDTDTRNAIRDGFFEILATTVRAFDAFANNKNQQQAASGEEPNSPDSAPIAVRSVVPEEILASFFDSLLKGEIREFDTEEAMLAELSRVMGTLFQYVRNRDVFEEAYRARLAPRLINGRYGTDLERALFAKLSEAVGSSFVFRLAGMMSDVESAKAMHAEYVEACREHADPDSPVAPSRPSDVVAYAFKAVHWPSAFSLSKERITVPPSVRTGIERFEQFYRRQYATRKLEWIVSVGSAVATVSFPKGTKEVEGTLPQIAVLEVLGRGGGEECMRLPQLANELGLDPRTVRAHMASIYKRQQCKLILRVDPETQAVRPDDDPDDLQNDCFKLNMEFKYKSRKIRTPGLASQQASTKSEAESDARRIAALTACVVRIMKSRHKMTKTDLMNVTVEQMSRIFGVQPKLVHAAIDSLVQREYLQVDEADSNVLIYVSC